MLKYPVMVYLKIGIFADASAVEAGQKPIQALAGHPHPAPSAGPAERLGRHPPRRCVPAGRPRIIERWQQEFQLEGAVVHTEKGVCVLRKG